MISFHPYQPFIPKNATKLIIGSMPPERFCFNEFGLRTTILFDRDVDFYYGSKDNHFWKIIADITNTTLDYQLTDQAITERKELLSTLNCGITDIVAECSRINSSASDIDLTIIQKQSIVALFTNNPKINQLIYTSPFVRQLVYAHFNEVLKNNWKILAKNNRQNFFTIAEKTFSDMTLYSPSPQALKGLGPNGAEKRKEQYLEVFKK